MKVRCIARELSEDQKVLYKLPGRFKPQHGVAVGKEYVVIAVSFVVNSPYYGDSPLFEVVNENLHLVSVPAALFEITDPRCSALWMAKAHEDGTVSLRPQELYRDYFYDKLSDREAETQEVFQALLDKLEAEMRP